jgi:rubrerythrin
MSKYRLSSSNVLEMAIAVEESSKEFYELLGERFISFKYHFRALAKDEERHARVFSQLLSHRARVIQNVDDEYVTVLEGFFVGLFGSLRDGPSRARRVSTIESAIEAAIQLEKDALLLYLSMNRAFENLGEQEIDEILKEEYYHLQRVRNLKSSWHNLLTVKINFNIIWDPSFDERTLS